MNVEQKTQMNSLQEFERTSREWSKIEKLVDLLSINSVSS